jgi:TPR repeat protein
VLALAGLNFEAEECRLLVSADQGDSEAQTAMGQHFFLARRYPVAVYWFERAAAQGDADAMQCLGQCYAAGNGVARDDNLALMWIAKAAAQGHVIARQQMAALSGRSGG